MQEFPKQKDKTKQKQKPFEGGEGYSTMQNASGEGGLKMNLCQVTSGAKERKLLLHAAFSGTSGLWRLEH